MTPFVTKKRSFFAASEAATPIAADCAVESTYCDPFVMVDTPIGSHSSSTSSLASLSSQQQQQRSELALRKRKKDNSFLPKPEHIANYEARFNDPHDNTGNNSHEKQYNCRTQKSFDQLLKYFEEKKFSPQMEMLPEGSNGRYSQVLNLNHEFAVPAHQHNTTASGGSPGSHDFFDGPVLLIFFGAMNETHLQSINNCCNELFDKYGLQVVGISANARANYLKFPILSDDKASFARFFEILDPLGGGVYPLDRMVLIDAKGIARAEFAIRNSSLKCYTSERSGNGVSSQPLSNESAIVNLVECLEYLKRTSS